MDHKTCIGKIGSNKYIMHLVHFIKILLLQKIQIKVSGGRTGLDGRLEVLPPNHHEWGVICGDEWSLKEAIVACRHFGLGYGMQAAKVTN